MTLTAVTQSGFRAQNSVRLLPLLVLCASVISLPSLSLWGAGERITAHVDPDGRVIFVNESAPPPPERRVIASTEQNSPPDFPEAPSEPRFSQNFAASNRSHLEGMIEEAASYHQVDPELIRAMVEVESNYNPNAVSPKGARGLMQLIPATAQRFGVQNIFDPRSNLDGGIRYLKYLLELFDGDLQLSLAAYNAGENAVGRVRRVPAIPETRDYLRKIARIYSPRSPSITSDTRTIILKSVDSRGIAHFTNSDLPSDSRLSWDQEGLP